jgi:hypothetical protein
VIPEKFRRRAERDERLPAGCLLSRRNVVRGFEQWLVLGAMLSSFGCERKVPSAETAPGVSTPAVAPPPATPAAQPSASAALAAGAPADAPSPQPGHTMADVLSCKGMSEHGFHITVEGDGAPQIMREGSRVETLAAGTLRYCSAAAQKATPNGRLTLFGCVSRSDPTRSCLSISEQGARYLDREGREWSVQLGAFNAKSRDDALEGTAQLSAWRAGEAKQLEVSFRAGTKIPSVPERESPYFTK